MSGVAVAGLIGTAPILFFYAVYTLTSTCQHCLQDVCLADSLTAPHTLISGTSGMSWRR